MPLYRLETIFKNRFVLRILRMSDWIAYAIGNWISTIYRSILNGMTSGTTFKSTSRRSCMLKGKSHKGYFWVCGRPGDDVCIDCTLDRGKQDCESIVSEFEGFDDYVVYYKACHGLPITQLGCWEHARRKFYGAWKNGEAELRHYLLHIRKL